MRLTEKQYKELFSKSLDYKLNKYRNKSIPTYYCRITKKITNKNNKICDMYEEGKNYV